MKLTTKAIRPNYDCDEYNRALVPPVCQNSMFMLYEIGERAPYRYSRLSNPTCQILEDMVAGLECGAADFAFFSGMVGIDAVWRTFLRPGDTITIIADTYGGIHDLLVDVYKEWGVNVVPVDLGSPDRLDEPLAAYNVKLVWLETPSSPPLRLVDVKTLAAKARAAGTLIGIDDTFVTPYLQQPLEMGCDIVSRSATEYLCGHPDVLMGIVAIKTKELAKPLHGMMVHTGTVAGPMDCWLILRSIKALALRMKAHCENALDITRRLEAHPAVEEVFYPDLLSYEHYELVKAQTPKDISGVVTVYLKNDTRETVNSVTRNMKLVKMVSGFGDVENLVNRRYF